MTPARNARTQKLIKPRLQLKLVWSFVGLAALGMSLQFLLMSVQVMRVASSAGDGGGDIARNVPVMMLGVLALTFAVLLPVIYLFGLTLTNRIAGPVYRMERYLQDLLADRMVEPMVLRDRDQLQFLCELINDATAERRVQNEVLAAEAESEPDLAVEGVSEEDLDEPIELEAA